MRKKRIGKVVSNKCDKTIVVEVERIFKHPLYKKYIRRKNKLMAHDEKNEANVGDIVEITETRPLSKRKRWFLSKIIKRAEVGEI